MKKKEKRKRSKITIFLAWLFLFILILCVVGVIYIKFFMNIENDNDIMEEHPITDNDDAANDLLSIMNLFNNSSLLSSYKEQNILMVATASEDSFVVDYSNNYTKKYVFTKDESNLKIIISEEDRNDSIFMEDFYKVFPIVVTAVQENIGNTNDISSIVGDFLNNNTSVDGLLKLEEDNKLIYSIDITKIINTTTSQNDDNNSSVSDDANTEESE